MNLRHIFILPALLAAMACSDDSPVTPDTPDTPEGPDITNSVEKLVSIDAGQTFQTIAGFGASDCWSPAFVGKSWTSHRAGITELLFSSEIVGGKPKGIGLSQWRVNLGGGSAAQGEASSIEDKSRRAESYLTDDLTYDWTRCEGQRYFMDRAKELGCTNTVFTNPTGLPDDNQHTTAHDLALIMQAAIRNDSFRTISGATSYTIPATNVSGGTRNLTSSFTMTDPASASYYEGCIGGRESTTTASGSVLVTAAQRNGTTLIAVVMNGATGQTANEAISLLDYGFSNFQLLDLSEDDFHILSGGTVMVPSGATADDLTTEDTESDGQILRTYSFGGTQVGTAVVEDPSQESSSDVLENDENMDSAKAYSESRSQIPYFAIGGVGILLLILLLWRMIRIIRS